MTSRDPIPLGDALGDVGRQLGLPARGAFDLLREIWPDIVGTDVATHTRVRSVRDGECVVEVDGPAWATRVRYLGPELRRCANERAGGEIVARVTVVVSGPRRTR